MVSTTTVRPSWKKRNLAGESTQTALGTTRRDIFYYCYIWIIYNLLDVITTHIGLVLGLPEGNPIPALVVESGSPELLALYKMSFATGWLALVVWLALRRERMWITLRLANILVFGAVFWNTLLIASLF